VKAATIARAFLIFDPLLLKPPGLSWVTVNKGQIMARSATISSRSTRAYALLGIGGASVLVNGALLCYGYYLVNINQAPLAQIVVTHRCNEPGYSQWMHQIDRASSNPTQDKKFAAASECFTDYQTGKQLDLDSLRPQAGGDQVLPAHP